MFTLSFHEGDLNQVLKTQPEKSVDVIFADPPYNIQNKQDKYASARLLKEKAWKAHYHEYDHIDDYTQFTLLWLSSVQRVLKNTGSLFITGTHHNIHHIGMVLKQLGYWTVCEIAWCKPNAMPNVMMTNPTQSVEWVIWARKSKEHSHIYDKNAARYYTENGTNLRTYWMINKPSSRLFKYPGRKPVALVYRCIDISTMKGTEEKPIEITIVDPFCGSGTTGSAAKQFGLYHEYTSVNCTLVDIKPEAISIARERLAQPIEMILKEK